jgi:hypothetical protein
VKIKPAEDSKGNVITPAHVWLLSSAVAVTTKPSMVQNFPDTTTIPVLSKD